MINNNQETDKLLAGLIKHVENDRNRHPHREREFILKCSQCSARVKVVDIESPKTSDNNQYCPSCGAFLLD